MTTPQIIIFSILGILDFYLTIVRPIHKETSVTDPNIIMLGLSKMIILWAICLSITFSFNEQKEQLKGKCPEYEQIQEPVYKLKI